MGIQERVHSRVRWESVAHGPGARRDRAHGVVGHAWPRPQSWLPSVHGLLARVARVTHGGWRVGSRPSHPWHPGRHPLAVHGHLVGCGHPSVTHEVTHLRRRLHVHVVGWHPLHHAWRNVHG